MREEGTEALVGRMGRRCTRGDKTRSERTLVVGVRDGRVVDETDGLKILLKTGEVFDVSSVLVLNAGLSK